MLLILRLLLVSMLFSGGSGHVTMSFVGDVHPLYLQDAGHNRLERLKKDFSDSSFVFCNLESPLTRHNIRTAGKSAASLKARRDYILRSPPESAPYLAKMGFNVVSLANNHAMDYGDRGFLDTLEVLDRHGIAYCGGGRNANDANAPVIVVKNGIKAAFIARSEIVPLMSRAEGNYPGIAGIGYPPSQEDLNGIITAIKTARKKGAVIVVVSLHWGKEGSSAHEPYQREFAEKLLENGADCIIGHHPHVLRKIESYRGKTIAYSLGNFIFGSADRPTKMLKIRFEKNKENIWTQQMSQLDYYIKNCIPVPVK